MTKAERVIDECLKALKAARLLVMKSADLEASKTLNLIENAIAAAADYEGEPSD